MPHLSFSFSAPYYLRGVPSSQTRYLWIACHGYGQLAERFIRRFDVLNEAQHLVVAPQGLARFYVKQWEEVGASWMTKEDRETDLINQFAYLDAVWEEVTAKLEPGSYRVILFGFSQGVATVSRWAVHKNIAWHRFIAWAGTLPPDLPSGIWKTLPHDASLWFVAGNADPLVTPERMVTQLDWAGKLAQTVEYLPFEGGHEVRRDVLIDLVGRLDVGPLI